MNDTHNSSQDELETLRRQYVHSSTSLTAVRQAYIEALGDFMCDPAATPPSQRDFEMLETLAMNQAAARERYRQRVAAFASALVGTINTKATARPTRAISRRPRRPAD